MNRHPVRPIILLGALLLVAAGPALGSRPLPQPGGGRLTYLPLISGPSACPATSGNGYAAGPAYQRDNDNPVRPAWNHADKNLALRSYQSNPGAFKGFVNYGTNDPTQPPQLATLFSPYRVPAFTNAYEVFNWNWLPSPNPGTRGSLDTQWGVTVLGLATARGEALRVPVSGYSLGQGMSVIVLYADASSITFKYTRDDSVAPNGYTLHMDNLCTDPNLLALYHALDTGARYIYRGPSYNLPNLPAGQLFGTARGAEVRVAIVDSGAFMDPRSCGDWWEIRPGRGCP